LRGIELFLSRVGQELEFGRGANCLQAIRLALHEKSNYRSVYLALDTPGSVLVVRATGSAELSPRLDFAMTV